jgi:transposase InsO family protein
MTESAAAETPMSELLKRAILQFGVPKQIVTDAGRDFASKSVSDVLASFGVEHRIEVPSRVSNRSDL